MGLPAEARIFNNSGAGLSYTLWIYDDYNNQRLQEAPGVVGHDPAYGLGFYSRGNVTGVQRSSDGSRLDVGEYSIFDVAGNLVRQIDANGHVTSYEYNGDGANQYAFPTKIINALGQQTTAAYDYWIGQPGWSGDTNGTYTFYDHNDPLDRLTGMRVVSGNETLRQTSYRYPNRQQIITLNDRDRAGDGILHSETLYDGLGRVTTQRQYENATQFIDTTTTYDALGRVAVQRNPSRPGDGLNFPVTYSYDALGRVIGTTRQDGSAAAVNYLGPVATATDEAGKVKRSRYDALGRLVQVTDDPGGANLSATYSYDANDQLAGVDQGGQHRILSTIRCGDCGRCRIRRAAPRCMRTTRAETYAPSSTSGVLRPPTPMTPSTGLRRKAPAMAA